ncbi:MAG: 3-ketoacyl-ACP reductase [Desulfofustis sp.]
MKNNNQPMPKAAVVSGGARGIGLGISRALAAEGYDLAVIGQRAESEVDSLAALRESGTSVSYYQADLGNTGDISRAVQLILDHFPAINVLVNNAGIAPRVRADLLKTTEESYQEVLDINLRGPFFLTQKIANHMASVRRSDPAQPAMIITISSISATLASVERGEYCISKAGLAMLSKLFAVRMAEFDIPVFEIRPGIIETDMTAGVKSTYDKRIADGLCLTRRWGLPDDIGRVVGGLVRGDFCYSTGQVFMVDGGLTVDRL